MAGYSKTPLPAKLGLKPQMRAIFLHMPAGVRKALAPLPEDLKLAKTLEAGGRGWITYTSLRKIRLI